MRISADTRAATTSKNDQQDRKSLIFLSSSVLFVGSCSTLEGAKEMPQKSVEPGPTLSSITLKGPAASNSFAIRADAATGR